MKRILFALSGAAAVALTTAPAADAKPKTYVCTKWNDGICVSAHRVKGTPAPYAVGYVFGPDYGYTTYTNIPNQVTGYYHLDSNGRYVYSNGYVYVVDPTSYAVTRVIDTWPH